MTNPVRHLKVAILQHSKKTPPGSCTEWATARGHKVSIHHLYLGEALPVLAETDLLIVLGGPMNVDDVHEHAWLTEEKALLKSAIAAEKTCLGLCLGGQLFAQTLGANVSPNRHWEVGWKPVQLADRTEPLQVFQFHQDHFSLPPGAERLATNEITENQAYRYRDHLVGIQFHPESTEDWIRYCALDKARPSDGPYVDSAEAMLEGVAHLPAMKSWFFDLLDGLAARAARAERL